MAPAAATPLGNRASQEPRLVWLIPVISCAVLLVQLLFSVVQLSQTADEPTHLHAGYLALKCGDFSKSPEHPPLAKLVAALPLLTMHLKDTPKCGEGASEEDPGLRLVYMNDAESVLFHARAAVSLFSIVLCVLVWTAARRMFGVAVAIIATGLLTFEPNVLAHGALITNDVALAATFLFTVFAFYLWVTRRSALYLVLTGVGIGLTLTAKISGVLVVPVLCALAVCEIWRARGRTAIRYLLGLVPAGLFAAAVVWSVYGFHYAAATDGNSMLRTPDTLWLTALGDRFHLLPESYVEGLRTATVMTGVGRPVFLFGRLYQHGRWFYFPAAMTIKLTAPVLILLVAAAFGAKSLWHEKPREFIFLFVPATVFLAASMRSQLNIGFRYMLPLIPFLLIFAAAGCVQFARRFRRMHDFLLVALVWHALSSVHAMPNYISYANEFWGGPGNTYKYLTDSNTDWGQGIKEVKAYVKQHRGPCWLAAFPFTVVEYYSVPCRQFGIVAQSLPRHVQGTAIISSFYLSGVLREYGIPDMKPFSDLTPTDRIGGSAMLVFTGDFDMRVPAGVGEVMLARYARHAGDRYQWLEHAQKAVELIPETGIAYAELCKSLAAVGEPAFAVLTACTVAREKLTKDPFCRKSELDGVDQVLSRASALP